MNPVFLIYALLTVIGLLILFAYIRCGFKRLRCWWAIRRLCRRMGYEVRTRHPMWPFASRYVPWYDLVIRTPKEAFAVKLFGCLWPLKMLILREYGEYVFRGFSAYLKFIINFIDSWPHPVPEYRICRRHADLAGETPRRVLLICPMPLEIRLQPNNGQEQVSGTGDHICGMEMADLAHLLRIMENAA